MIDLARRIRIGERRTAWRCAAVAAFLVSSSLGTSLRAAESEGVAAASALIETFDAVCAAQVEQGRIADKSHLVALTGDQIASLSSVLGLRARPQAVWSEQEAGWYQIQRKLGQPEVCQFVTFEIGLTDMQTAWTARFADDDAWQSFSAATIRKSETTREGRTLTGAYAFRRFEGAVIMAAAAGMELNETGVVLLRYQKAPPSTEACANGAKECN